VLLLGELTYVFILNFDELKWDFCVCEDGV